MPILKKKNKSVIPSSNELAALDGSVDELSRQTEALLKGFGDVAPKNDSPTRKIAPEQKTPEIKETPTKPRPHTPAKQGVARSFDIIHTPAKRKLQASLRSQPQPQSSDRLLSSHAGLSYNEQTPPAPKEPEELTASNAPAIVHPHATGALHMKGEEDAQAPEDSQGTPEDTSAVTPKRETTLESSAAADTKVEEKSSATQSLTFQTDEQSPVDESPEQTEDTTPPQEESSEAASDSDATTVEHAKQKDEPLPRNSSYSATASQSSDPKGYEPVEGQTLPAVFDTHEYHPELHDWSKLEHRSHATKYVIALLLVIVAILGYLVVSDTALPFIG